LPRGVALTLAAERRRNDFLIELRAVLHERPENAMGGRRFQTRYVTISLPATDGVAFNKP
jgi:hypothetical protein